MEGCLYKNDDNYYLINNIASYNILVVEFQTFRSYFISKQDFDYEIIEYNTDNIKQLLDNYIEFKNYIDYTFLKEFNQITYNNRIYYFRSWYDVFNFAAGRI